jgi:hypothetical protein
VRGPVRKGGRVRPFNKIVRQHVAIAEITAIFRERFPSDEEFQHFCETESLETRGALDAIALYVGRCFLDGSLSYEDGDAIMNLVWSFALKRDEIPDTMYAIYEAFDGGEYFRSSDAAEVDPVEKYTRPALQRVLGDKRAV